MVEKSCDSCINCEKNSSFWGCENYDKSVGMPVKVSPPYNEACSNWSDNPGDRNKASDELRYFVDHFWDDKEDYD